MAIYDSLPYTNFHELNRRWLLQQMAEAKAKVDSIQEEINQFNEDYAALAAVFTVSGNNVSIPGTMTANGFNGNLTGNVTGNLTGNVTGNLTGDVTGDVIGDLTGNVTGGSFQGSYVEATNGQITHNLTVGNDAEIFNNLTVDGTIFGNVTGNVSGNAATATTADGLSGTASINTTGTITAAGFSGPLTGNVTGNLTGTASFTSNFTMRTDITSADADDYLPSVDGMAVFKTGELSTHIMSSLSGEYFVIIAVKEGTHGWQIAYCPYGSSDIYFRTKFSSWSNWLKVTATTAA